MCEEFSSATPNSMMQEFFITLLLTNLSALVKADADEEIKNKSRPKNKFNYQANRTFIIGRMPKHKQRLWIHFYDVFMVVSFP